MCKMAKMLDLLGTEEDGRAEEMVFSIFPPFGMELHAESLKFALKFGIQGCPGMIRVHLGFVGLVLALWGRVCCMHTCHVLGIADVTARQY